MIGEIRVERVGIDKTRGVVTVTRTEGGTWTLLREGTDPVDVSEQEAWAAVAAIEPWVATAITTSSLELREALIDHLTFIPTDEEYDWSEAGDIAFEPWKMTGSETDPDLTCAPYPLSIDGTHWMRIEGTEVEGIVPLDAWGQATTLETWHSSEFVQQDDFYGGELRYSHQVGPIGTRRLVSIGQDSYQEAECSAYEQTTRAAAAIIFIDDALGSTISAYAWLQPWLYEAIALRTAAGHDATVHRAQYLERPAGLPEGEEYFEPIESTEDFDVSFALGPADLTELRTLIAARRGVDFVDGVLNGTIYPAVR